MSSRQNRFDVWFEDRARPADAGGAHDLVHRREPLAQAVPERLERGVETEFVTVSETVDDGAGRCCDRNRHAEHRAANDAVGEHRLREPDDPNLRRRSSRPAGLAVDGYPDLVRGLGSDRVNAERRHQQMTA